jgi:flagellar basal-body rod modification protein FlgD
MEIAASATNAATTKARATLSDNFDTFLTLLTTQLSNQDPLDPIDSNQFTQQLVQYSQVEQQIQTNDSLQSLLTQNRSAAGATALTYLGRTATIDDASVHVGNAGGAWTYTLDEAAQSVRLSIVDSTGRTVLSRAGETRPGAHALTWDGRTGANTQALPGTYKLVVAAETADGKALNASVQVEEVITGVDFTTDTPSIVTATGARAFDTIRAVRQ